MPGQKTALAAVILIATSSWAEPLAAPIEPGADDGGFDWVQIDSGEWLRGEFVRLQDETLYFDSEEFDDVELDWGDISALVSSGSHTFRIEGREPAQGEFEMRNGVVYIDTGTEQIEVASVEVLALIPGEGRELDFWSFKASLSFSGQDGNTEQTDLTIRGDTHREDALTRWSTGYRGNFASSDGDTTADNHRASSSFDYFLTSRLFLNLVSLEYYTDEFQNIATRFTAGAGAGYEVIQSSLLEWEVVAGGAYQLNNYESVGPNEDDTEHDGAAVFGTRLDFDLPLGIEWDNSYKTQVIVTDLEKTNHHAESILDFDIWGPLDFEVGFVFDRIEQPQRKSDGERPERNDYQVTVGLAIEY
jgi:hypothetical protein